ncbi:MAG: hypothetical protein IH942_03865 [Acidobacteria bacterium]|nr:hypothetical protein [Acidobacteriota bacterium]
MRSSARLLALITGGFILGSVANLFWETRVVPDVAHGERIAVLRDDGRLVTLTGSTRSTPKERFLAATALLEIARGGTLRVPSEDSVDRYTVTRLARMTVEVADYRSELTETEALHLLGFVRFDGRGQLGDSTSSAVEFYIISSSNEPGPLSMSLLFHNGAAFIVDDDLMGELRR